MDLFVFPRVLPPVKRVRRVYDLSVCDATDPYGSRTKE